jgi:dTDP-4-dehydrorhamnose reductase
MHRTVNFTSQEKTLIVGINSRIGSALKNFLVSKNIMLFGTTRKKEMVNEHTHYLDLEDPEISVFATHFTTAVICAATTDLNELSANPEKYKILNVINTIRLIEMLAKNGCFIIYLSSNAVFNGEKQFYKFNEETSPTTLYGKFKVEVEEFLTKKLPIESCVLRLTKVITKKTKFIERWEKEAKAGDEIRTYDNRLMSPVDIEYVVNAIFLLITEKKGGIYQLGGQNEISYTDYARIYFKNNNSALSLIRPETENTKSGFTYNSLFTHLPTKLKL